MCVLLVYCLHQTHVCSEQAVCKLKVDEWIASQTSSSDSCCLLAQWCVVVVVYILAVDGCRRSTEAFRINY